MNRVLYLANILPKRSETFVYREILALRKLGYEIDTASVRAPELDLGSPELDELSQSTVEVYSRGVIRLVADASVEVLRHPLKSMRTLMRLFGDVLFARDLRLSARAKVLWQGMASLALARRVGGRGIEHIHVHFAHVPATIGMYCSIQLRVGFSFTGHANDLFPSRTLLKEKIQRARFVNCISEWHRDFYRSIVHREDDDLIIVRCGVDTALYEVTPLPRGEIFELLAVGRLVEKKGFDLLLRALASVGREKGEQIHLTLVGDGPMWEPLQRLADELPANVGVTFTGSMENSVIMDLMGTADLVVLPCRVTSSGDRDGIPVVLMEGMVRGRCVLCGDLETIRELVEDGVSGVLVPAGDQAALERKIQELRFAPQRIEELGRGARRRIEQEFDLTLNARRMAERLEREPPGPSEQ